jgi:cryptochrome
LVNLGSRLIVLRGTTEEIFKILFASKNFKNLFYEKDSEPYPLKRDNEINELGKSHKLNIESFVGHTLYDLDDLLKENKGIVAGSYKEFIGLMEKMPKIKELVRDPQKNEIKNFEKVENLLQKIGYKGDLSIPKLNEITDREGKALKEKPTNKYKGGETEGLKTLYNYMKDKKKVANYEKPKTSPCDFEPASTTVLSPHLRFGTVSIKKFYLELKQVLKEIPKHTIPPVSLMGQIYWREFFYLNSYARKNFHKMKDNNSCKEVDWYLNEFPNTNKNKTQEEKNAEENYKAWKEGNTGYPFIDAMMIQLREEGWIHHLGRHCVACFLTRGDLYINWERGMEVFEEYLLDADYALNAGNWLWLSGSSIFFTAYFRIYSPIAFPKKYDPEGKYVKKYIPQLKKFPKEFIYEPWKASKSQQESYGCILGKDYPNRIVIHEDASRENMNKLKNAMAKNKTNKSKNETNYLSDDSDLEESSEVIKKNTSKRMMSKSVIKDSTNETNKDNDKKMKIKSKSSPKKITKKTKNDKNLDLSTSSNEDKDKDEDEVDNKIKTKENKIKQRKTKASLNLNKNDVILKHKRNFSESFDEEEEEKSQKRNQVKKRKI